MAILFDIVSENEFRRIRSRGTPCRLPLIVGTADPAELRNRPLLAGTMSRSTELFSVGYYIDARGKKVVRIAPQPRRRGTHRPGVRFLAERP